MSFIKRTLAFGAVLILLAGCTSTGQRFNSSGLSSLIPGQTTRDEAARILQGPPANVFAQSDGSKLVLWSFATTLVTDGLYVRREALLQFGPDDRLMRLVDSTNIFLSGDQRQRLLGPAPAPVVLTPQVTAPQAFEPVVITQTVAPQRIGPVAPVTTAPAKKKKAAPAAATVAPVADTAGVTPAPAAVTPVPDSVATPAPAVAAPAADPATSSSPAPASSPAQ